MRCVLAVALVSVGALAVNADPARACSCEEWPDGQTVEQREAEATERAAEVFIGVATADAYKPDDDFFGPDHFVTFDVERAFKGEPGDPVEIRASYGDGDTCGAGFEIGARYKVFVGRGSDGQRTTMSCAGNRRASAEEATATATAPPTTASRPPPSTTTTAPTTSTTAAAPTTMTPSTTSAATTNDEPIALDLRPSSSERDWPTNPLRSFAAGALLLVFASWLRVARRTATARRTGE